MRKRLVAAVLTAALLMTNTGVVYAAETTETDTVSIQSSEASATESGETYEDKKDSADVKEKGNFGEADALNAENAENMQSLEDIQNAQIERTAGEYNYTVVDGKVSITKYNGAGGIVVIPEMINGTEVTEIGESAFRGLTAVTEVVIPDSVQEIKKEAFRDCTGIERVTLSKNLTYIGAAAFYGCSLLTAIEIPAALDKTADEYDYTGPFAETGLKIVTFEEGAAQIAQRLFKGCTSLEEIIIPDTVTQINREAFMNCSGLRSVDFGNGVEVIEDSVFEGCSSLTKAVMPDTVTRVEEEAFKENTSLSEVKLSGNLSYLGAGAFRGCELLTAIEIPAALDKAADEYDYTGPFAETGLKKVTFGEGIPKIAQRLFKDCITLEEITLPDSVEEIEYAAFRNCSSLKKIDIPDGVIRIENEAFLGDSALSEVELSDHLEYIGTAAFRGCELLTSIEIPASLDRTADEYDYTGPFAETGLKTVTFAEGATQIAQRLFRDCKLLEEIIIPDTVTQIDREAFMNCTALRSVDLGNGVEAIEDLAFENCSSLIKVVMPDTVTRVEEEAFKENTSLSEVKLSGNLSYLGAGAFRGCELLTAIEIPAALNKAADEYDYTGPFAETGLKKVTFGDGIPKIAQRLFKDCTTLEEITLPDSVEEIGYAAFRNCSSLKKIDIPDGVIRIENEAFLGDSALSEVELSNHLEYIGTAAFRGCELLTSIEIPASLDKTADEYDYTGPFAETGLKTVTFAEGATQVAQRLFRDCKLLEEIIIPDTVTQIDREAFMNCTALRSADLGNGVEAIEDSAFENCSSLTKVVMPDTVTRVEEEAFKENSSLSEVKLSGNLSYLGAGAFRGCELLTAIEIPAALNRTADEYDYTGPFAETNLRKVTFEDGITVIARRLFKDVSTIREIIIPEGVTSVGDYAFENMENLESVYIPTSVSNIGRDILRNSENAIINCGVESYALEYAMDNDYTFYIADWDEYEPKAIDKKESYYTSNSESQTGFMEMIVYYDLKDEMADKISEKEVVVYLPPNLQLIEGTVKKDKTNLDTYTYEGRKLIVPVDETSGTIRFSVNLLENKKMSTMAWLNYSYSGETEKDIIAVYTLDRDNLTLISNDLTSDTTVEFEGVAPFGSTVSIAVDQEEKTQVTATKSGYYSGTVELENPQDGKTYTITASAEADGEALSKSVTVKYDLSNPVVEEFKLYYSDHTKSYAYDLMNNESLTRTIVFYPTAGYTFKVRMSHPERIKKLYVNSTRGGITRQIEAEYDADTGYFVTNSKFEEGNDNYVPGMLSVDYELDYEKIYDSVESRADQILNEYSAENELTGNEIQNVTVTESSVDCTVNVTDDLQLSYQYREYTKDEFVQFLEEEGLLDKTKAISTYADESVYDITDLLKKLLKSYVINGIKTYNGCLDGNYYTVQYEETNEIFRTWVIKSPIKYAAKEQLEDICFSVWGNNLPVELDKASGAVFGFAWESGTAFIDFMGTMWELDMQIRPGMTEAQMAQIESARSVAFCMLLSRIVNASLPVIGVAGGVPGMIICGIAHYIIGDLLDSGGDFSKMNAVNQVIALTINKFLSWIIDPSGYVYEAVTDNRLSGVTVTAYWKTDENAEAVLWDASEYQQMNPLVTDSYGAYAWDVPEGYWQVKYEKEGYETVYSDWMPVPPPQTDVNIGLVSKEKPVIESFTVYADHADVVFSKYMIPDTVSSLKLSDQNGNDISYELEYDTTSVNSEGVNYAKEYTLRFTGNSVLTPESTCRLTADGSAKSYADVAMDAGETVTVVNKNIEIIAPDKAVVKMGETLEIPVMVANASEELSFTAVSEFEEIASVTEIGENSIKVTGNMYGEADITISVPGTDLVKTIRVTVGKTTEEAEVTPTVVLPQSVYTMKAGEELTVVPEVYPETAEGSWSIISGEDVIAAKGNTFTAKKSGEAVLRYTLAEYEDVFAECRIIVEADGDVVRGDADGNKTVDIADLRMVLRSVCGKVDFTEQQKLAADVTDDGRVDIQDLRKILRYVCRKIDEL